MGTSIRPVLTTLPASAKTLVPLLVSVPTVRNQLAPSRMMTGTLAQVSTLLMSVGLAKSPTAAGYGGRGLGIPRAPSMEWISAVSSPQTKAPAPSRISISNEKFEPRMFSPSKPCDRASSMAFWILLIANGYSARM